MLQRLTHGRGVRLEHDSDLAACLAAAALQDGLQG
jgi:hypothetical protein